MDIAAMSKMSEEELLKFLRDNGATNEDLREFIAEADPTTAPPGEGMQVNAVRNAAAKELERRTNPQPEAENIEPSSIKRFLAAMGGRMTEPFYGAQEKFSLMFPGNGNDRTLEEVAQQRAERRNIQNALEQTTAGQAGGFLGRALPFAIAPQTATSQMLTAGLTGFLSGGPNSPTSITDELTTSTVQGGLDAAATGAVMKGLQLGGRAINGALGRYTPNGKKAMELDSAAKRLGLPSPTIGQLDDLTPEQLRASPDLIKRQADALERKMAAVRSVPNPAGGVQQQVVPGGALKAGLEDAINARKAEARSMYQAVDDYIKSNNLPNITPNYTVNTLQAIAKRYTKPGKSADENRIFRMFDTEDPQAFSWLKAAGSPKRAKEIGMDFTAYQDARTLVNGVLTDLRAIKPANRKGWQNDAIKDLEELIKAMDNDVDRWAKTNADHQEVVDLLGRAKEFYRTVTVPATQNEVARKVMLPQTKGGYASIERLYSDLINPANRSLVDQLLPTASRETQDILRVMRDLPDVGATVASGKIPNTVDSGGLTALAAGVVGHPGAAAFHMAPGLRWLSSQHPTKLVHFGKTPTNRALGPVGQYMAEPLSDKTQELLSLKAR